MPASTAISRQEHDEWYDLLRVIRKGRLRFVTPLGEGGTARVARVRDTRLHRDFALKILHPEYVDGPLVRRLQREAQLVGRVHATRRRGFEHVIEVTDVGFEPQPWLLVPYFPGGDLQLHLSKFGPMPPHQALEVTMQVLRGLIAADEVGLVHRDIKPANLFIDAAGRVVIADFGLAKSSLDVLPQQGERTGHTFQTKVGVVMGTPWYAAPEQLEDASTADHRADVYAVGVLLLYLLTCKAHPSDRATYFLNKKKLQGLYDGVPQFLLDIIHEATRQDRGPDLKKEDEEADQSKPPSKPVGPIRLQHARDMLRLLEEAQPLLDQLPVSTYEAHDLGSAMHQDRQACAEAPSSADASVSAPRVQFTAVPEEAYDQITGGGEIRPAPSAPPSTSGVSFLEGSTGLPAQNTQDEFGVGPMSDDEFEDELAQVKQERQAAMRRWAPALILAALALLAVGGWFAFGTDGVSPDVAEAVPAASPPIEVPVEEPPIQTASLPPEDEPMLASVTPGAAAPVRATVRETKAPVVVERQPEPEQPKSKVPVVVQPEPPAAEIIPEPEQPAEPEVQTGRVDLGDTSVFVSYRITCGGTPVELSAVPLGVSCKLHYEFKESMTGGGTSTPFTLTSQSRTFSCNPLFGTCN